MVKARALRKRYILFEYSGPLTTEDPLKKSIYAAALRFFGELGLSYAALKLVSFDPLKRTGILRCERDHLSKVLGFLALVSSLDGSEVRLKACRSSGTLRSLSSVLESTQ